MKQIKCKYIIYYRGNEIGRNLAVSSIEAIRNYRFTHGGPLKMAQENADGDDRYYSAKLAIVAEFEQFKSQIEPKGAEYEQMELFR